MTKAAKVENGREFGRKLLESEENWQCVPEDNFLRIKHRPSRYFATVFFVFVAIVVVVLFFFVE